MDWPYTVASNTQDWIELVLCEWKNLDISCQIPVSQRNLINGGRTPIRSVIPAAYRIMAKHLRAYNLLFIEQLVFPDGIHMLTFYDLTILSGFPQARRLPEWFDKLSDLLLLDSNTREMNTHFPHKNTFQHDFTPPTKIPNKSMYVIGWHLGTNKPFLGQLLKTVDNYAHILHLTSAVSLHGRTLLIDCNRCNFFNPNAFVPQQILNKDRKCFTIIPNNLCFNIPVEHSQLEKVPYCS